MNCDYGRKVLLSQVKKKRKKMDVFFPTAIYYYNSLFIWSDYKFSVTCNVLYVNLILTIDSCHIFRLLY